MKIYVKNLIGTFCCLLSFYGISADEKSRPSKHVDVKCYVELVGGGETVAFWNVREKQVAKLAQRIHGQKVHSAGYGKKQNIYKVHECVLLKDEFSTEQARRVDNNTAR
ncbi:hypothetical protein tinsulaeT_04990 [Thalassotalea insulae]|uniref:Uncharacterized protein n=1 Tax=Thalassotalea insulae TaxID=2056778 RepID=A0ABQ6GNN1_9GAMM|nr:TapY2 family type IVa secretion system protein [Thalassotalea insulae]GLX77159.1 hypothetical protein tinsulaeT_04990 [Thalassotalea insulae]